MAEKLELLIAENILAFSLADQDGQPDVTKMDVSVGFTSVGWDTPFTWNEIRCLALAVKEADQGGPLFAVKQNRQDDFTRVMAAACRKLALEEAAVFCSKLGHPHAASEIRRQLIRGEGGDHAE